MTEVILIANGDLRLSANQACEAAQAEMERQIGDALRREGATLRRGHPYDPSKGHGFIDSQKMGMEVFRSIPPDAHLIVAEAVWQYSQHLLAGLMTHRGPILTVANWSGTWPGLVGLLNLNGSLTKAGVRYSTLWSEQFTDPFFTNGLRQWLTEGQVTHDTGHVRNWESETPLDPPASGGRQESLRAPRSSASSGERSLADTPSGKEDATSIGEQIARELKRDKAILGVFDEGCMGMYNAIIPDELLHKTGVYKERLSQSTLYAKMRDVSDSDARAVYDWLRDRGMTFHLGVDEQHDLTEAQVVEQCRMYIAVVRLAGEFGCAAVGIQYQQGLKDLTPASDLVEGLLNNVDRPPVGHEITGNLLFDGEALPHFNEVDECAGLDALVTNRIWRALGYPPETTLHDLRWGRHYRDETLDDYVWVFLISGAVPPAHLIGGYAGATSERQPPMYFRLGGGTIKGVSKPGHIVWSRVYIEDGRLKFDTGLAEVVALPEDETEERWRLTTPQWPIMHAVLKGISRDQMMAKHKSNHIQVVYAPNEQAARRGLWAKAAAMNALGIDVTLCGDI